MTQAKELNTMSFFSGIKKRSCVNGNGVPSDTDDLLYVIFICKFLNLDELNLKGNLKIIFFLCLNGVFQLIERLTFNTTIF